MRLLEEEDFDIEDLKKQREIFQSKIKSSPFPDPEDIAKLKELNSLISGFDLSNAEVSKFKSSNRVTPFSKKRT